MRTGGPVVFRLLSQHPAASHLPVGRAGHGLRPGLVRQHLVPALGARRVRDLDADDVAQVPAAPATDWGVRRTTTAKTVWFRVTAQP